MIVLGIETSCDDTGLAILKWHDSGAAEILSECVSSQDEIHREYGGVVPELASRAHLRNLPLLLESACQQAGVELSQIELIGVTCGPGLQGCLLMGLSFAKGLALALDIPLLGIHHIEGHLIAPVMDNPQLKFPYIALVVSGGHTEILLVRALGDYEVLARTIDDAAGEAFDKSAHLLGFEYPGGAALADLADSVAHSSFSLPEVMKGKPDFSFSGLKTAISLLIAENREVPASMKTEIDPIVRGELACAIQAAIVRALVQKLEKAVRSSGVSRIAVTGGVSANRALREAVSALPGTEVFLSEMRHCVDNGAMIAYLTGLRHSAGQSPRAALGVQPRWPVEQVGLPQEAA